jgi:hypothetical protein
MFADSRRTVHEPEPEELLALLPAVRSGAISSRKLRRLLLARHQRLQLQVESSHLLGSFVPALVSTFRTARFILLVRDCRSWIDSMINDQLNLRTWSGYTEWSVVYDRYLGTTETPFPDAELVLRDLDLYPLANYVRYYREEIRAIVSAVPPERLLCLRTEDLSRSTSVLADFVGVPRESLCTENAHSYRARRRHDVLDAIDPGHLTRVLAS